MVRKYYEEIELSLRFCEFLVRAAGCEVHFFDRHYPFGLNWYRKRMPLTITGQLTMEKTPSYFVTSQVPARVYKMNPKIK
jgi:[heparan sulfate]-glucosamine 3-sulfotransferase 3